MSSYGMPLNINVASASHILALILRVAKSSYRRVNDGSACIAGLTAIIAASGLLTVIMCNYN
jgi:hypothetical protein